LLPPFLTANIIAFLANENKHKPLYLLGLSHFLKLFSNPKTTYCVSKKAEKHLLCICEFEHKDQEMLMYLFIYILPFIRSGVATFATEWITSIFLLLIIAFAIAQANAFHFNPIMVLFGYHFYAIKDSQGVSNLLISKEDLRCPNIEVQTVQITGNVYLQTENVDVFKFPSCSNHS